MQWVNHPTHILGHTLDLILSFGLSITEMEVIQTLISKHFPIIFNVSLPAIPLNTVDDIRLSRAYSPCFPEELLSTILKSVPQFQ